MPQLAPHPATAGKHVRSVEVDAQRTLCGGLSLRYRVHGDIERLQLAAEPGGSRREELWRHTCFEVFARTAPASAYTELNFAANGDWAAYRFDEYREGMRHADIEAPRISCRRSAALLDVHVSVQLPASLHDPTCPLLLALATVIETRPGELSYWALCHAPGKPDFHAAAAFALTLEPAG